MKHWKTRRGAMGLVAVTTLTALVAGCAGGAGGANSGATSKSLVYWSMWNKPEPQAQVLQKAADAFEKSTGIHVDIKWIGRKVLTNVSANLNGGNLPDLTEQEGGELTATFGAADAAMGLNDVCAAKVTGENVNVCDVVPRTLVDRYKTKDGQPMMMPYELVSSALWYNAAQLPDVASKPPVTWSEWMSVLDREKNAGRPPLALDGSEGQYDNYWWTWSAMRHAGPGAVNAAVSDKTGAGWDNPALLAAAQDIAQLVKGGYFTPNYSGSKWPAVQTGWANGENKSDFLLMGSWAPSETAPFGAVNPKKFVYRSMPYPQVVNGKGNDATEMYLIGFAIPKKAKNPENAKKFIEFFLNKDQLSGISSTALNLTPRSDIEVPAQLADLKKQVQAAGTNLFAADDGVNAAFPQFTTESLYPNAQKLILGKLDAAGYIKAMKAATIEYWKNHA